MNTTPHRFRSAGLACLLSAATLLPVWAASHQGAQADPGKPAAQTPANDMADGEVRKVDKEGARITLKHGEIKSLDMPPMTMVFLVKDKAALEGLKAGDKVRFKAIQEAGKYTVTDLQVVR